MIFCSILLFLSHAWAVTDDVQRTWFGIFGRKAFNENYSMHQEFQLRYDLENGEMQQSLIRFGVLQKYNEKHELGYIFAFVSSTASKEYRPTLQHVYLSKLGESFPLLIRSRLELRDIENNDDNSFRYRMLLNLRYQASSHFSYLIWNEAFFNLSREMWTGDRTFERNRLFMGGRIDQSYGRWEVGYLNQYIPRTPRSTMEHMAVFYFYF